MKIMINKILPKNKIEWIIVSGFLMYFLLDIVHRYFSFDLINITPESALIEWLIRVGRDCSLTSSISLMIIAGIRLIRKDGFTLNRLINPALGIFLALVCLCVSLLAYHRLTSLQQDMGRTSDAVRNKIESSINTENIMPDKKLIRSKYYAYTKFVEDGILTNYFTSNGKIEMFQPTEKERSDREDYLKSIKLFKWSIRSLNFSIYFWLVVIAASLALGFLTPIKKKLSNSVNAEPSAQVKP